MEYREVCLRDGTRTGKIVEKSAPRRRGDYFHHVLIVLKTEDSPRPGQGEGAYIVQQRSWNSHYYAGKWDVTGGSVRVGETPAQAIVRETAEELNLSLPPQSLRLVREFPMDWADGTGLLISMFACRCPVPEEGFCWDEEEVNDVKVLPYHVFRAHLMDHNDDAFGQMLDEIEKSL